MNQLAQVVVLVSIAALMSPTSAFASHYRRSHHSHPGNVCEMVAPNEENFSADQPAPESVDQETFFSILQAVQLVYAPIVAEHGGNLIIHPAWDVDEPNAFATRLNDGKDWIVQVNGGIARASYMSADGLLLVACHEVGHHLGGAPYKSTSAWKAAAEGEADYFASLKCMRTVLSSFAFGPRPEPVLPAVSSYIQTRCQALGGTTADFAICERTHLAAQHLGWTLTGLMNAPRIHAGLPPIPPTDLTTPAKFVSPRTITAGYPEDQCRVDTYAAGSVCPVDVRYEIKTANTSFGACTSSGIAAPPSNFVFPTGARPSCWYRQI